MKRPAAYPTCPPAIPSSNPKEGPPGESATTRKLRNLIRGKLLHRQPAWVEHAVVGPGGVEVDPEWAGMEGAHGPGLEDAGEWED